MREVKLTQGKVALVDAEDYEKLSQYKWCAANGASGHCAVYATYVNGVQVTVYMHRLVMGVTDSSVVVDHINHNRLDNRKSNLRLCTHKENLMNRKPRKGSSSKYLGVTFAKARNKWRSRIVVDGKHIEGGSFNCEIEAAKARDVLSKKYFGEFANLNFKD